MVIRFLIEKEFKQMVRNVILPIVFVMLPLGMINVMPKAATQEVKNLKRMEVSQHFMTASRLRKPVDLKQSTMIFRWASTSNIRPRDAPCE